MVAPLDEEQGPSAVVNPYPTAIHNFKWVKITDICVIWDQTFTQLDVETVISFPVRVIEWANEMDLKRCD